jgi:FecR protein
LTAEAALAGDGKANGTRYGFVRRSLLQLAGISLVALSTGHGDAVAREIAGSVEELRGEAFAQAEQERRKLENTASIFLGDDVSTGSASRLAIRLGKETTVRLGELVHLTINRSVEDAGGELTLASGPLLFDRAPGAQPKPLHIRSSFGLIAVRGTRFFAGPSAGVFGVFVQRGSVSVSAAGTEVILREGEGTNIARPGDAPTPASPWHQPRIDAAFESIT